MTYIVSSPDYLQHRTGFLHPECPERAQVIVEQLLKNGYLHKNNLLVPRLAKEEELLLCHTPEYVSLVQEEVANCRQGCKMLSTGDVIISSHSYDVARLAVGGALVACDAVMQKRAQNVFCVLRPPGHHACSNMGMGFCLFNNVAIAARYVQAHYAIKKVLIVDFDVHHGNGTQEIFDSDPSVYYFSTHQKGIYPGTGLESDCGKGAAQGTKCNALIETGSESKNLVFKAFQEKLLPAMEKFRPEFVLISCGFDAHKKDPLGGLALEDDDFFELTSIICDIAKKYAHSRVVSVLEGGYNLEAIGQASCRHVAALKKAANC
jgi:acetoin utilization deacetylase AcuC-like enzyme